MLYLASPYSHPKSVIREVRYLAALQACASFQKHGICVVSPIVHWHHCAQLHKLPPDSETWAKQWYPVLKRATGFAILLLPGWEESIGVKDEWIEATQLGLKIDTYKPDEDGLQYCGLGPVVWPTSTPLLPSANVV